MRCKTVLVAIFMMITLASYAQSVEVTNIRKSLNNISDSSRYVDALNRLAMLLYEKNIDSTFVYTAKARQIANRLDYVKGKADAINNLGVVFDIKGNVQLALRYYDEAFRNYTQLHDSVNVVESLMNIAMVYKEIGKDQRAIQEFNEALSLGRKLRQDSIMSLTIYNYLLEYPAKFNRDSMGYYIARAKSIAAKYHDQRTLIAIDQLVADDMISHGSREKGLALLDSTINAAIRHNLYYVSMDMMIDMGDQLATSDPVKAAGYYQRGLTVAGENGYLIYSQIMARKLFDLYTLHHDSLQAATYSRQLVALNDEQAKLNNASSIDYLDYVYKDQQIRSLSVRSKYQTVLLILAAVVCLLAITIIVVIKRTLARTRLLNRQVQEQYVQMKGTLDALEQSQADNSRMMKIVAHDLRNPIGAITSLAALMLDNDSYPEEDRMMLEMIRTSGNNSLELVSDLLQVHTRTEELKMEMVDLDQMLHYCVDLLENKASSKGQQLKLDSLPVTIAASREKLWRVVSNLIANAIKFSPTGATIHISLESVPEKVIIAVKDNGIGIPEEMGNKIFDMFTDSKRPGTAGEQPFGLGLAISKQIVEAHGGKIWYESHPGNGTTFYVELPKGA
ncbi:Signal transduction histidine kinase [Mucilaginibacter mallensis]|uniref:histidine kinase n=2 Tax=Mucilaginibacter mallensis TaxID=652787 RepID=A0A1H1S7S5_MUCMA|nr:Signal transduction histidine kinase [Mucilaginibacter mallensis]